MLVENVSEERSHVGSKSPSAHSASGTTARNTFLPLLQTEYHDSQMRISFPDLKLNIMTLMTICLIGLNVEQIVYIIGSEYDISI